MPKTMTLEEFTHATGQDLLNDAHAYGDVVVKNEAGREVGVFHVKQRSVEDVLQDVRKEWDDRLAVLNEPG